MDWKAYCRKPFAWPTSTLFLLAVLGVLLNTWLANEILLDRQVFHRLLDEQIEAYRIDELLIVMRRLTVWNYVLAPLLLALRLLLSALFLQMPLVFRLLEVPFARLFHIVTVAFFALLLLMFVKTLWLASLPNSAIDESTLSLVPVSLAALVNRYRYSPQALGFLGNFNLSELAWCLIVTAGLRVESRLTWLDCGLVVVIVWTAMLVMQFVFLLYFHEISG